MSSSDSLLASKAFGDLADSGLVVAYQSHQDALRFLASELTQTNATTLLLGPSGSGKSTIAKEQRDWTKQQAAVALISGVRLTPRQLVAGMLAQFGVSSTSRDDQQLLQELSNFVVRIARNAQAPVLILDDADRATPSALRLLDWLATLETDGNSALRIVLTGKQKLVSILRDDSVRNLRRRNPSSYALNPMSTRETLIYLRTRLIAAGGERAEKVFPIDVCNKLRGVSRGWPGKVNELAYDALQHSTELRSVRSVPRIIVSRDGSVVGAYELSDKQYLIGRADLSDIVIPDAYASKLHAMLQVFSNALILVDLNSTNGVTVNSKPVLKTVLRSDDIITLGHYRLKVENAPGISDEFSECIKATDTILMQNLEDMRRTRARRTVKALQDEQLTEENVV